MKINQQQTASHTRLGLDHFFYKKIKKIC
jgi:hypothetical protein